MASHDGILNILVSRRRIMGTEKPDTYLYHYRLPSPNNGYGEARYLYLQLLKEGTLSEIIAAIENDDFVCDPIFQ